MSRRRVLNEKGSVIPLAICMMVVLFAVVAIGVDFALDYAMSTNQNSDLQIAAEEAQSTASSFVLGNAEEPGKKLAKQVMTSIRRQGYQGKITVDYWEAPQGWTSGGKALPDDARLMVFGVSIDGEYPTMFARVVGIETFSVTASDVFSIAPVSQGEAWRPSSYACGTYTLDDGGDPAEASLSPHSSLSSFSQKVQDKAKAQLATL